MIKFVTRFMMITVLAGIVAGGAAGCKKKDQQATPMAPAFAETTLDGQKISVDQLKGKVVLLDFFATWCPPCQASVPHLVDLNKKYGGDGLVVVGLSVDDDTEALKKFVADRKIDYPIAVAGDETKTAYGIRSIPHMFILNRKGEIVETHLGFDEQAGAAMEATIKKLLGEK